MISSFINQVIPHLRCVNRIIMTTSSTIKQPCFLMTINLADYQKRFAGHSKWQNIRHIKGAKDAIKAKINSRISHDIAVAIKEGNGCDPKFNIKLAHVIERAEKFDVPKKNVQDALKRSKEGKPRTTHFVDAKGPGNCALIIETYCESTVKCKNELNLVFKKFGLKLAGSQASYAFHKKGMIYIPRDNMTLEQAEDVAIETGAEEVEECENDDGYLEYKLICSAEEMFAVKKVLEDKNVTISRHFLEYVPKDLLPISEDAQDKLGKLIERLDTMDDVVQIFDNVDVADHEAGSTS